MASNVDATESTPLVVQSRQAPSTRSKPLRWIAAASVLAVLAPFLLSGSRDKDTNTTVEAAHAEYESSTDPAYRDYFAMLESSMNASVDPCDDFYLHACGNWLATHDIAPGSAYNNAGISPIDEETARTIQSILDAGPPGVGELHASCIVTHRQVDEEGVNFVADLIHSIQTKNSTLELMAYAGDLYRTLGINTFFTVDVIADPSDPDQNVLSVAQGGLTLPSREYYLEARKLEQLAPLLSQYQDDLTDVAGLAGFNWTGFHDSVFATESALAKIAAPATDLRDPWNSYTPMRLDQIERLSPWLAAYIQALHVPDAVVVRIPRVFADLNGVLTSLRLDQVKHFVAFHVIDAFGDYLGESIRRARQRLRGSYRGTGFVEHEEFCRETTSSSLATKIGEYYMEQTFPADTHASAEELVAELNNAMAELLPSQAWLDSATLDGAKKKLHHLRNLLGGPISPAPLPSTLSATAFFANIVEIKRLNTAEKLRQVGQPVDHTQWTTLKATDCDCDYIPSQNTIVYPAANWRPPMFSATSFPAVANYARIGMLIGHEVSHGYDDMGRNYDETGRRRDWWSVSAVQAFKKRAQCLVDQYSQLPVVVDGVTLGNTKGDLTLGENIADNGGIRLAYAAYQSHKRKIGITDNDDKLFFLSFGQSWCEKLSLEYAEVLRERNQHSMSQWRVNVPLMNFDTFANAYQCKLGSPMNPEKKCVVWG